MKVQKQETEAEEHISQARSKNKKMNLVSFSSQLEFGGK